MANIKVKHTSICIENSPRSMGIVGANSKIIKKDTQYKVIILINRTSFYCPWFGMGITKRNL